MSCPVACALVLMGVFVPGTGRSPLPCPFRMYTQPPSLWLRVRDTGFSAQRGRHQPAGAAERSKFSPSRAADVIRRYTRAESIITHRALHVIDGSKGAPVNSGLPEPGKTSIRIPLDEQLAGDRIGVQRPVDMWEFLLFIVISHRRRELVDVEHQHPVRPRIGGVELIGNPKKGIEPVGRVNESVLLEGLGYVGPGGTLRLPDRLRRQVIRNAGIARLVEIGRAHV